MIDAPGHSSLHLFLSSHYPLCASPVALRAWLVSPGRSLDPASLCSSSDFLLSPFAVSRYGLAARNVLPGCDPWYYGIHFKAISSLQWKAAVMRMAALQHVSFYFLVLSVGKSGFSIY